VDRSLEDLRSEIRPGGRSGDRRGTRALATGRASKLGPVESQGGEITVGVKPDRKPFCADVRAWEKACAPVYFVATGLLGPIKINEGVLLCWRIDAPISKLISNSAWTISLNFELAQGDDSCREARRTPTTDPIKPRARLRPWFPSPRSS
jgi:hypothetical protein